MDTKRTAAATTCALLMTACTGLERPSESADGTGQTSSDAEADWIEQLDPATLRIALPSPIDLVPGYDYQPGEYSATVPERPDGIWERLRREFTLPRVDNERVARQRRLFAGREAFFRRVAERSEPYLYTLLERLEAREMPAELLVVAIVESGMRPFAYSHGQAAGIWQFIPGTGRNFGLTMNYWYDGRRDLIAATEAALDYFEHLHGVFDGDWLLALAAYNAGEGNVLEAVRQARRQGVEPTFWNLELPGETMGYVPRILALRDILDQPEAHGITLPRIPNEQRLRVVEPGHQIDLARAADLAGIRLERLYRLNPGYNRWATAPEGPHHLLLPVDHAERFERALAELDPDKLVQWRRHRVDDGETLSHIADQYDVTVSLLREVNGLEGQAIRSGEHLYVPIASRASQEYVLSETNRLRAARQRQRPGVRREHTVRPGETLWEIAQAYEVEVRELASWNRMAPADPLHPGQELVLWIDDGSLEGGAGPNQRTQSVTYTVRQGDSLSRIGQRFNVPVGQIKQWNGLADDSYLQPGQKLQLKVDVTRQGGSS